MSIFLNICMCTCNCICMFGNVSIKPCRFPKHFYPIFHRGSIFQVRDSHTVASLSCCRNSTTWGYRKTVWRKNESPRSRASHNQQLKQPDANPFLLASAMHSQLVALRIARPDFPETLPRKDWSPNGPCLLEAWPHSQCQTWCRAIHDGTPGLTSQNIDFDGMPMMLFVGGILVWDKVNPS